MAIIAPDVNPQPIPGVRFQPSASETTFGGGPGLEGENQQIQKIAQDSGNIAAFERIRANQMAVEDAQAKGSGLTTDVLYDPQTGVLGSHGKDALQAQKDGMGRLQKGMNDIATTLTTEQQDAFNKWAISQVDTANHHMMAHVDEQLKIQDTQSHTNLVDNQAALVALGHGNPATLALAFGTVKDNTTAYAQRNRLDPDQTKQLLQDTNDKMHTAVIDGMLKFQKDDSAQKYFDANKDQISPDARLKITEGLTEGNTRRAAANAAQSAINNNPDSEQDALQSLSKIKDAVAQDSARKLVTARFSENRAAVKNDQDDMFMKMSTMVNQKGLTDPIDRRMAIPPMAWNKMSAEQQRAIEKGGTPDETSINKWEEFTQAVKDGSISKMSQADLNSKFIPYFNATDQKTAVDYWSGVKKGNGGGAKEKSYESVLQMNDSALVNIGALSAKNPTKDQLTFKKQFSDAVDRDLDLQQNALGRPLKQEEIQSVVDKHTLKALDRQSGQWFPAVGYDKIPDSDKQHIIELARNVGVTATRSHIEEAYALHKQGKSDDDIAKALK